ncbi:MULTISPECIES: hypothetical protein [Rhodococcus]|uniref:hypothetical protein n=1 Tax=Rhodococcus TaxID=1827 RepID=UPI0002E13837|nr:MULTISPECIES: hypothetical protein [Rhodococcus]QQZ18733.1 hypothetical protein GO592_34840 [Rhodococcus sp. 21391]
MRERDIQRENLAGFVVEAPPNPGLKRTIADATGGQTPIAQAVTALARSVGPRR